MNTRRSKRRKRVQAFYACLLLDVDHTTRPFLIIPHGPRRVLDASIRSICSDGTDTLGFLRGTMWHRCLQRLALQLG